MGGMMSETEVKDPDPVNEAAKFLASRPTMAGMMAQMIKDGDNLSRCVKDEIAPLRKHYPGLVSDVEKLDNDFILAIRDVLSFARKAREHAFSLQGQIELVRHWAKAHIEKKKREN